MDQFDLLQAAVSVFQRLSIPYFVTGSIASSFYGEYRSTHDIDIVVDLKSEHITAICESFPEPDYYVSEDAVRSAISRKSQFNVLHVPTASKVDVIIQDASPYDRLRFSRAQNEALAEGLTIRLASVEDVILKKLVYYKEGGSDKHLRDIAGMLRISKERIDRGYIDSWANKLNVSTEWREVQKGEQQAD